MGERPHLPLLEPENPKAIEVISFSRNAEGVGVLFYREGELKECFEQIKMSALWDWAVKNKYIFPVYELPVYDQENNEEYMVVYPPTSESGTADEVNATYLKRFIEGLNDWTIEQILKA